MVRSMLFISQLVAAFFALALPASAFGCFYSGDYVQMWIKNETPDAWAWATPYQPRLGAWCTAPNSSKVQPYGGRPGEPKNSFLVGRVPDHLYIEIASRESCHHPLFTAKHVHPNWKVEIPQYYGEGGKYHDCQGVRIYKTTIYVRKVNGSYIASPN